MTTIDRLLIVMAMEYEAKPLIDKLGLKLSNQKLEGLTAKVYQGMVNGKEVTLVTQGKCSTHGVDQVGTVIAATTTHAAIRAFKPDLILNAGTAGGLEKEGANIGDVYSVVESRYHDRVIDLDGHPEEKAYKAYGEGLRFCAPAAYMVEKLGLKTGKISTGDSFAASRLDLDLEEMNLFEVHGKEMELAAIMQVAAGFPIPVISLKAITDIVRKTPGKTPDKQFTENLEPVSDTLAKKAVEVVRFALGKTLDYINTGKVELNDQTEAVNGSLATLTPWLTQSSLPNACSADNAGLTEKQENKFHFFAKVKI